MRKRRNKKQFWFNDEEILTLRNNSNKVGMNESSYIRSLIMGYQPREKPDEEFYEFIKLLRAISNNMNQIAKKANVKGQVEAEEYTKNVELLFSFISEVKDKYLYPEIID